MECGRRPTGSGQLARLGLPDRAILAGIAFFVNLGLENRPLRSSHAPIGSEAISVQAVLRSVAPAAHRGA